MKKKSLTIEIPKELLAELRPFYSSLITDEEMVIFAVEDQITSATMANLRKKIERLEQEIRKSAMDVVRKVPAKELKSALRSLRMLRVV